MKRTTKPPAKLARKPRRRARPVLAITFKEVQEPVSYLEIKIAEAVTEKIARRVFETICNGAIARKSNRILLDMREGSFALTISDLFEMAKMVAAAFAGMVDRMALVLRKEDMPAEKFFEPSLSNRGVPTLATADYAEATYWVCLKRKPIR